MAPKAKKKATSASKGTGSSSSSGTAASSSSSAPSLAPAKTAKAGKSSKKTDKKSGGGAHAGDESSSSSALPTLQSANSPMKHAALESSATTVQMFCRSIFSVLVIHRKRESIQAMKKAAHRAWQESILMERKKEERRRKREEEIKRKREEERRDRQALMEAAYEGNLTVVQDLIAKGIPVDFQKAEQYSPLSEAACGGAVPVVQFLLKRNADVNQRGQYQRTPIWRAAFAGHAEVIKVLLQAGADPRLEAQQQAPLEVASGECKKILQEWNVAETDRLLVEYEKQRQKARDLDQQNRTSQCKMIEGRLPSLEKADQVAQKALAKARQSYEQRILEYDKCVRDEKTNLQDTALKYIKDAEAELQACKEKADAAREALMLARAELRDAQSSTAAEGESSMAPKRPGLECAIEDLVDVVWKDIGKQIRKTGKWPLVVDPSNQAVTFLRYRDIVYINLLTSHDMAADRLRLLLLGALRYGKPLVFDFMDVDLAKELEQIIGNIHPNLFADLMSNELVTKEKYNLISKPSDPEQLKPESFRSEELEEFRVFVCTSALDPNDRLLELMTPVWVAADMMDMMMGDDDE